MSQYIKNFPIEKIKTAGHRSLHEPLLLQPTGEFDVIDAIWLDKWYGLLDGWHRVEAAKNAGQEEIVACIQTGGPPEYFVAIRKNDPQHPEDVDSLSDGDPDSVSHSDEVY